MQNNDSRLIKAAKRGICAEATLIIVIIVIASWSVYGLYKLAFGLTDNLFGFSLTKLATTSTDNGQTGKQAIEQQQALEQKISKNLSSQLQSGNKQANTQQHPIYSASNPIHSQHHPLAIINGNPINSQFPSSSLDLNLIHMTNLLNKHHNGQFFQPNQLMTNTKLINPTTNNNNILGSSNFVPTYQAPVGRATKSYEQPTSSSDDYEVASAGANFDYSNDRQAEESNRDPGESIVDNSSQSSEDEEQQDSTTAAPEASNEGDTNRDEEESSPQQQQLETTTSSDFLASTTVGPESNEDDNSYQDTNKDQDSPINKSSNEQHSQDTDEEKEKEEPANEGNTPSQEDEESARATSLSIDEEVDRMTQPSLSSIMQQDGPPINLNRNTVQFDDLPNTSSSQGSVAGNRSSYKISVGDANSDDMVAAIPRKRIKHEETNDTKINDHDTIRVRPAQSRKKALHPLRQTMTNDVDRRKMMRDGERDERAREKAPRDKLKKAETSILHRQRRHVITNTLRVPRNIDEFLDNLDISNLIEQSFDKPELNNERLSAFSKLSNQTSVSREFPDVSLDTASSETVGEKVIAPNGKKKKKKKRKRTSMSGPIRRSDDEEEDEDDDDTGEGESEEGRHRARSNLAGRKISNVRPHHHNHIMPNDTALQELLTRQYLFDSLRNSRLQMQSNQTGAANTTNNQVGIHDGQISVPGATDPQLASSLYSIEHGLDPASNDEYSVKTKKKKKKKKKKFEKKKEKKKHKKKKEKKKMTEGMKKGGFKKKKHKKEEKKYIKEKKFKGAKKGKKVSKGKGGQGGKKGKKLYKDKGFKKKGFKNVYHKEEFGQKKSYFDEFRDKDFKKKWKNFKDKYDYAQMKKWQAKDIKGAKKMKDHGEKYKKHEDGKWKKKYHKHSKEHSDSSKKHKKSEEF